MPPDDFKDMLDADSRFERSLLAIEIVVLAMLALITFLHIKYGA